MTGPEASDLAGARILDRLHANIASLVDGNHAAGSEVLRADGRSCACHLVYEVDWTFVPQTSSQRLHGNASVSTHFGYDQHQYDNETAHRCAVGRTHRPIRDGFMARVLRDGGAGLGDAGAAALVWDFGQHSVHERCSRCGGRGRISCYYCHGSGRQNCNHCSGHGTTTQTRWVHGHNGQGRHENYQQACYLCGGSGRVSCSTCHGSGDLQCGDCSGHGFFTDIMSVTVHAQPRVQITTRSGLSREALSNYLVAMACSHVVRYIDFTQRDHHEVDDDSWRVVYEADTTVVELDLTLRTRKYLAAAIGERALAFIRPTIFDDIFADEIAELDKIWTKKQKSFSSQRARKFFVAYTGQPVLDKAMKSVAMLKGVQRDHPGQQVLLACDGYVSKDTADRLGKSMAALLDKVSPPNSLWAWIGIMSLPFLVLFLGAQNWLERHAPADYFGLAIIWIAVAVAAAVVTAIVSPVAAGVSAVVSALRRRGVPAAYRQHGRNWQPFRPFVLVAVITASVGGGLGAILFR